VADRPDDRDRGLRPPDRRRGVGPLVWLLGTFARERKERYSAALELNRAYRGTVMLLSDVVEADDNYTADHCRGVVSLVTTVADELEIDEDARQELEFVALLHDVGKIVIPKDILNKPGALSDDEFELMKTHTIEGQVLLDRVGGLLGRVGAVVRSCHERWDGHGYPDGLAGYEIPLPARIVFACDAYNAMTTDRPYRAAMSQETAIEELWANAGTQFDPRVVAALASVIKRGGRRRALPRARGAHRARRHGRDGRGYRPRSGLLRASGSTSCSLPSSSSARPAAAEARTDATSSSGTPPAPPRLSRHRPRRTGAAG